MTPQTGGRAARAAPVERLPTFPRAPRLTEVVAAWAILAAVYASILGTSTLVFRVFTTPHTLARPWPYPDTKVWDPDGLYRKAGEPGPYRAAAHRLRITAQARARPGGAAC